MSYAIQNYAGEAAINSALPDYARGMTLQDPSYTFSPELVSRRRAVVPQPYLYLIGDMRESITLHENAAVSATAKKLPDESRGQHIKVNL